MTTTNPRYVHQKDDRVHRVPTEDLHSCQVIARSIAATLGLDPNDVRSVSVFTGSVVIETYVRDEQGNRLLHKDEPLTSYSLYQAAA